MTIGNIFEGLPRTLPDGTIKVEDEPHTFTVLDYGDTSSTKYEYQLDKSPFDRVVEVTGTYDGVTHTFEQGTDYTVVDNNGDGSLDTIDWSVGGKNPDENTQFYVTYVAESIVSRYVESHEEATDVTDVDIDSVIDSHQVDNATGSNLDRIGNLFGPLGERRGREDDEYSAFLKSIVQSFKGRGTRQGIRFAITAALDIEDDDFALEENFTDVEYTIILSDWIEHRTELVNDMAELADPSGVQLANITYVVDVEEVDVSDDISIGEKVTKHEAVGFDVTVSSRRSDASVTEDTGVGDTASTPSATSTSDGMGSNDAVTISTAVVVWGENWGTMNWN